MTFDIDAECKAALDRLARSAEERIAEFRKQSKAEYHAAIRSIAQRARRIREALEKR